MVTCLCEGLVLEMYNPELLYCKLWREKKKKSITDKTVFSLLLLNLENYPYFLLKQNLGTVQW